MKTLKKFDSKGNYIYRRTSFDTKQDITMLILGALLLLYWAFQVGQTMIHLAK